MEVQSVEAAPAMVLDVIAEGHDNAPLVVMLHEFSVPRFCWNAQVHAVAQGGYLAVPPNQSGHAAGART
jgi:hypothetical protein